MYLKNAGYQNKLHNMQNVFLNKYLYISVACQDHRGDQKRKKSAKYKNVGFSHAKYNGFPYWPCIMQFGLIEQEKSVFVYLIWLPYMYCMYIILNY